MASSSSTASGEKNYRPAVITFMDILGFKDIINNKSANEVYEIIRLVRNFSSPLSVVDLSEDDDLDFEKTIAINFSDSVIRIRYYDTQYPSGALFHEILSLVHVQADLANRGVLVRGGIAVGDVYVDDDNTVFGPGFVRAYNLESEFANYPRIVIDPAAFEELRADPRLVASDNDLEHDMHYIRKIVKQSDDGLWFVDYIGGIVEELDSPDYFGPLLQGHRELILNNARAAGRSLKITQKYLWLAKYHNQVCERYDFPDHMIVPGDMLYFENLDDISGIDADA